MRQIINVVMVTSVMMFVACGNGKQAVQEESENVDSVMTDSLGADSMDAGYLDGSMEIGTISDMNMWLRVSPSEVKTAQAKRLVDAYNASVVMNSLITDFDLQMRMGFMYKAVVDAVKGMDVTKVEDSEVRSKLQDYKKEMLYGLTADSSDVDYEKHNPWEAKWKLHEYLSKKFNVTTFGEMSEEKYWNRYDNCSSVPEWEDLRKKRGNDDMVEELKKKYNASKDFDARCIYAIELAHAYEADWESWTFDESQNPAVKIMESLMKERNYSLYLFELWRKWRVLYQNSKGASKDSEIPNDVYNNFRNICACTILSYVEEHPKDIFAINEFLILSYVDNILREGRFPLGNQNFNDDYNLFYEKYKKEENGEK